MSDILKQKFAVVNTWPQLQNAETECIARLQQAAAGLGLECIEVDARARTLAAPLRQLTQDDVDFVLSLHFSQPKQYDIFSFVTLWNPIEFLARWGYRQSTESILSHDDFLHCSSRETEDHVLRSISGAIRREAPLYDLYPSVGEALYEPDLGERKLLYAGINWDRIKVRRDWTGELLTLLDRTGRLRTFGPSSNDRCVSPLCVPSFIAWKERDS